MNTILKVIAVTLGLSLFFTPVFASQKVNTTSKSQSSLTPIFDIVLTSFSLIQQSKNSTVSKYDIAKMEAEANAKKNGFKIPDAFYKANKSNIENFKDITKQFWYVPEKELAKQSGHYAFTGLMTYKEAFDRGYTDSLRFEIDPDRMVWVVIAKYDTFKLEGIPIKKAVINVMYDAETKNDFGFEISSESPDGMKEFAEYQNSRISH